MPSLTPRTRRTAPHQTGVQQHSRPHNQKVKAQPDSSCPKSTSFDDQQLSRPPTGWTAQAGQPHGLPPAPSHCSFMTHPRGIQTLCTCALHEWMPVI